MFHKLDKRTQGWFFPDGQLEDLAKLFDATSFEGVVEDEIKLRVGLQLKHSRSFDNNLIAVGVGVDESVQSLKQIFKSSGHSFNKSIDSKLACLLANLYRRYLRSNTMWTGLNLHNGKAIPEIYNPSGVNPKSIKNLKAALEKEGFIYFVPGFNAKNASNSRSPKAIADESLVQFLEQEFGWEPTFIRYHHQARTIEMKSAKNEKGKRTLVDVELPKHIIEQGKLLEEYNRFLYDQLIMVPSDEGDFPDLIHTRRIFNNNDWQSGGRVFGGDYQQTSEALREKITINGEPVIELDIRSCHATMGFAHIGNNWYAHSNQDLYLRDELKAWDRSIIKIAFNIMLNAKDQQAAISALNYRQANSFLLEDLGLSPFKGWAKHLVNDVTSSFPELSGIFYSGLGNTFMNKEGNICMVIIRNSLESGVPILTLHDSFICPESYASTLDRLIKDAFQREVGATCVVEWSR